MARRLAWWLVVATVATNLAEVVVMLRTGVALISPAAFRNAFPIVNLATVIGALVGAVIISRHPRHRIGWLFCWGQLGVAVGLLVRAVADGWHGGSSTVPRPGQTADLVANLLGSQFALVLLAALLLLAPDGRLPSPRWRPVLGTVLVGYGLIVTGLVMIFTAGLTPAAETTVSVGQLGIITGLVASVTALLVRLRRASGVMRQQLRWVAAAAAVLAAAPVLAVIGNLTGWAPVAPWWVILLLHLGYGGVPVATGFAVLRYRLYDIDRLMTGSVVIAVVAVLTFLGSVLAIGLVGLVPAGRASSWVPLLVFVGVVLLFQTLRRAVRRFADRLVYGPHAMSYEALTRFTRQLSGSDLGTPYLAGVAEAAGRLVSAQRSTAVLLLPDGSEQRASWSSAGAEDIGPSATGWSSPVRHRELPIGRLDLTLPDVLADTARRRQLIASFCARIAEGFVHARLDASLRRQAEDLDRLNLALDDSRRRLLDARDLGRRLVVHRIRHEVVDRLQPVATVLGDVAQEGRSEPIRSMARVEGALESVARAVEALRRITSTVFSRKLAEGGLAAALPGEARPPDLVVNVVGAPRWPAAVESCLFACCSDLLGATSGEVVVGLAQADGAAVVSLRSTGHPPDPGWLTSAREQLEVLGGSVETQPDRVVVLRLPVIAAE